MIKRNSKGQFVKGYKGYWFKKTGKKHPAFKETNPDKIHPEVFKRFGINPKKIFKRDNWSCQQCGSKEDLTIHHIDGQGRNSKNKNNSLDNLITLCRKCHGRIHGKENERIIMNFSLALEILKNGGQIYREGWNGENQYLELQTPDENSKMTLPYIFIKTVDADLVPWIASQTDLLKDDWKEIEPLEPEPEQNPDGPTPEEEPAQ